jgi:hypothetical protein
MEVGNGGTAGKAQSVRITLGHPFDGLRRARVGI